MSLNDVVWVGINRNALMEILLRENTLIGTIYLIISHE